MCVSSFLFKALPRMSPSALPSGVMGGVCVGSHKTFACPPVFRRHASAFSSARWFHTKLILCIPDLSVKLDCFGFTWEVPTIQEGKAVLPGPAGLERAELAAVAAAAGAGKPLGGESAPLLCAVTFMPQQLLRSAHSGSFGIFDIFWIFSRRYCRCTVPCVWHRLHFVFLQSLVLFPVTFHAARGRTFCSLRCY